MNPVRILAWRKLVTETFNLLLGILKIILNFNVEAEHYKDLPEIFELTPKSIQGAGVEINIRENYGISYGAWSDAFDKYILSCILDSFRCSGIRKPFICMLGIW